MSGTESILSDRAAFMLAVAECQAMATEKQQLYDDPSCTAEQRRAMVLEVGEKWMEARRVHTAIRRQDLAAREKILKDTEERLDILDAIYERSILKHLRVPVVRKKEVIPIKLQMLYWSMSTVFVLSSQCLVLEAFARPSVSLPITLILLVLCFAQVDKVKTATYFAWYAFYGFVFAVCQGYIRILLLVESIETLAKWDVVIFRWSLAFFVISEAEWHRYLHKTMAHPVHRDIRPAGNPKASSLCQSMAMGATQTMLAACITFGLIICVGGGEAPSMTPLIVSGQFRPLYSPAQWIRRLPQSLIFIRPLSQLTAWLVEKAVELGSQFYHIFTGDIPVGPQQANTEFGTQTVE
ncbi:hypothetical protein HBI04_186600 [Parastagonospora nodorum]|nr:hypothetical protein HBH43_065380 [Parastagonospora nodorum]KAH4264142.1 hypothetical protein HBI04_186600 [Parastagonospora nodorum]KAH4270631.1 hypothetical protein HBI03_044330 [Parastagonospora nodorum]KAH4958571.1 hypothetical protein HBI78_177680 [Parastagonospora nodorum]KAH5057022.1 hypothetical protein HBH96_112230 [Parastagonospora nodorum]